MTPRPAYGKSKPAAHETHTHNNTHDSGMICEVPLVCRQVGTASFPPLTSEVIHEAGLGRNDPLGSRLAEDGDVVLWTLAECGQTAAQLASCFEDVLVGEPTVLTQDHLQGADNHGSAV